jgi:hypothetical protein
MHIDPLRQNSLGVNLLPHPLFPALYESHPDNTGVSRSSVPRAPPADFLRDITQKVCSPASSVMRDGTPGRKNTVGSIRGSSFDIPRSTAVSAPIQHHGSLNVLSGFEGFLIFFYVLSMY